MKDAVLGEKKEKATGHYTFRIRVTYETQQKNNLSLSLAMEKHRLLKKFDDFMKIVDEEGSITSWTASGEDDHIACNIGKLSPYTAEKYVGMPNGRKTLGTGKNRIGFRINSNLTLDQFLDAWGQNRRRKEWAYITRAEMQSSPSAYAIGICQGSSPNMSTEVINANLCKEIEVAQGTIEGSWQTIDPADLGGGIIQSLWKEAHKKAEEKTPQGAPKNRVKNRYAPSGLIIYVSEMTYKKTLKRTMTKRYGSGRTTKDWAIWPDGSMMRFIPFLLPNSSARSLNKVTSTIKHHIYSKATETTRDLEVVDLFTAKDYLEGKTMQQAILETESGKLPGMPVFKNITRKWSRNFLETNYQITSYATLTEEADAAAQGLMSSIQEKYGNEALLHFPEGSLLESYSFQTRKDIEAEDPETIKLLEDLDEHTVGNILAPEYISILELEAGGLTTEGASTIQFSEEDKTATSDKKTRKTQESETNDANNKHIKNNNNVDNNSEGSGMSIQTDNISILTEETDTSINTDDITVTTGFTTGISSPGGTEKLVLPKDLTPEEKVKLKREWKEATIVQKKLISIDASHEDIKAWKEANPEQAATVAELTSSKFKEMCGIIKIIASQKEKEKTQTKELPERPGEALQDS